MAKYSTRAKGGIIPREIWKKSREIGVDRKIVLSELKEEYIKALIQNGCDLTKTNTEFSAKWNKTLNEIGVMVYSWRKHDRFFEGEYKALTKRASMALMETALETHKKRIAYGDRELMVQNGKPVLTPKGMALKAKLEAEEYPDWQVLEELSNRHDQSQDIYVVRISYPENLVRQTLANVEAETFKSDYTPSKMSDDQIKALLAEITAKQLPTKSEQADEIIEAEVTEED